MLLRSADIHFAEAQQTEKIPGIGYLSGSSVSANGPRNEAFRQGLRELGDIEGKNIVIERRCAEGKPNPWLAKRESA